MGKHFPSYNRLIYGARTRHKWHVSDGQTPDKIFKSEIHVNSVDELLVRLDSSLVLWVFAENINEMLDQTSLRDYSAV